MFRFAIWLLAAATLLFGTALLWFALTVPDPVPAHFDISGNVDRWESKAGFVGSMGGIGVAMLVLFGTSRLWIAKIPARAINLPGRKRHEYWTSPANRPSLNHTVATSLEIIGVATMGLLTSIVLISGVVAHGVDVPGVVFGAQFVIFLLVLAWGIGYLIANTRMPAS